MITVAEFIKDKEAVLAVKSVTKAFVQKTFDIEAEAGSRLTMVTVADIREELDDTGMIEVSKIADLAKQEGASHIRIETGYSWTDIELVGKRMLRETEDQTIARIQTVIKQAKDEYKESSVEQAEEIEMYKMLKEKYGDL